ncbi:ThuA domain-containing protein [Paenibacillus sp. PR3]|uniref:ThuA domain-containing protein n=1 Tax=Paenibacillus terricola TaxID=2763503 RepID=A0ABR8N086_9BACL|nr:ThuA domain-containing protein [Paenibacillus terricola]MBD3921608.1 ThuA domain-containing protein [Paenibacillus terricola]
MVKGIGRAVLFGDVEAPYHPVQAVEQDVTAILAPSFSVETVVEYGDALEGQSSLHADVIISYADRWTEKLTEKQADGLLAYVWEGGGLVSLHCGISLAIHERLLPLFGAKFTGHPPFQPLKFVPVSEARKANTEGEATASEEADRSAALLAAIESFELDEEPYRYEFADAPNGDREVLLQYGHEGALHPAVWTQAYGLGRIINVMPGHTADSLSHPAVRRLLLAATKWAARG